MAADQPGPFEAHNHLVHCRTADPKEPLHIGFGRRLAIHQRVGMDEGQILPLPRGEAGSRIV